MRILGLLAVLALIILPTAIQAKDFQFYETLSELNRIDPMQNPRVRQGASITDSNIQDRQNKVVGRVKDMVLSTNGKLQMLNIDFDKLKLPNDVYMAYNSKDIRSFTNSYGLNVTSDRIEDIYPELLASIQTGAGAQGDTYSMNTIKGATIKTKDGHKLGKVTDILFNIEGTVAKSLYITVNYKSERGKSLAIPYDLVKVVPTSNAKPDLLVTQNQLDTIVEYLKSHK